MLGLDRMILIPAAQQPLKHGRHSASAAQRLAMTQLACAANKAFEVSSVELDRSGPSYTVITLEVLRKAISGEVFFVLGADAASQLGHWYAAERIIELAHIVVVGRPGTVPNQDALINTFPGLAGRMSLLEGPQLAISSTAIRQRVAAQQPIRYLTPDPVVDYIARHNLYKMLG